MTSSLVSIAGFSLGLITGPVLARSVGPAGRGEIAAVVQAAWLLGWLLCFGLPLAAAYWSDDTSEGELLATITLFGVTLGAIVCLPLWFLIPVYLADQSGVAVLWTRLFLLVLPLSAGVNAAMELRRRRGAGRAWNAWRIAPAVVSAFGIVLLAIAGRLSVATALACYFIAGLIPMAHLVLRVAHVNERQPSLRALRRLLPYAWRAAAMTGASSITGRLDQVVLAAVVPSHQLGLYAVAVTTASVTNMLTIGLPLALFGQHRADGKTAQSSDRYRRSMVATFGVSSLAALAIGVLAPFLLGFAFGERFKPATGPLRMLLPGAVAFDLLGLMSSKLSAEGRVGELTQAALLGASVTVIGLIAIVPTFGIDGAATVTSVTFASQVGYLLVRERRWKASVQPSE